MHPIGTFHWWPWQTFGTRPRSVRVKAPGMITSPTSSTVPVTAAIIVTVARDGSTDTAPAAAGVLTSGRGASATVALISRSIGGRVLIVMRQRGLARPVTTGGRRAHVGGYRSLSATARWPPPVKGGRPSLVIVVLRVLPCP